MTKEEYTIYAEDLIKDISNRIDELRQRSNGIDEKKRLHFEEKVTELTRLRDDLDHQIQNFDQADEISWEGVKAEFKKALDILKKDFESLFTILSE